jgi:tetratricopeptide (TPR) repeat protein
MSIFRPTPTFAADFRALASSAERRNLNAALRLAAGAMVSATMLMGCETSGGRAISSEAEIATTREAVGAGFVTSAENAIRDGDLDRALEEFLRALEANPDLTSAHMGMADIYRMRGDYARAETRYRQAARVEPRNFDAQYFHGLMLHLLDRLTEAVQAYLRALSISPNDFKANLNLATAYYQLDENASGLPYARKAVELDPVSGPARVNLGAIYGALNRHGDAVKEYQQAAELMPLTPQLLTNLAESLGKLDRFQEMANALEQCIKLEASAPTFERLGFARFQLRQFDAAKVAFDNSLRMDAGYFPALNGSGICALNDWIKGGRKETALRDRGLGMLRRSLQTNPDQPRILEIVSRYGR